MLFLQKSFLFAVSILKLVQPAGIEPASMALQTTAMTTSAKVALLVRGKGIEPLTERWQRSVIPFN